jgi:quinol-cytochrome oxidoreductase complex cytochrome b subunit
MATQAQAASAQEPTRKSWIDYIQKDLPEHLDWWPYTLGAIPMTLFGVLVVTGLLLTLYYVPSAEERPTKASSRSPARCISDGSSGACTKCPWTS